MSDWDDNNNIVDYTGGTLIDGLGGTYTLRLGNANAKEYLIERLEDGSYRLNWLTAPADSPQSFVIKNIEQIEFRDGTYNPSSLVLNHLDGTDGIDNLDASTSEGNSSLPWLITGGHGDDNITGSNSELDVASYSSAAGDYLIYLEVDPNDADKSRVHVVDLLPGSPDGDDVIEGVGYLRFSDKVVSMRDFGVDN